MDTDAQENTEETIFTGDDLMKGPPSPLIPLDLGPQILEGVELCSNQLRKLFECLHKNDIEPFCQDQILLYHRCSQNRDALVREKIYKAEETLGRVLPEDLLQERVADLQKDATLLERRFILASATEGVEGFRQRWSVNGQLQDTRKRMESLARGLATSKHREPEVPAPEVPAPEVPAPEVPAPGVPAPEVPAPEVPAPEVPAPEVPASSSTSPTRRAWWRFW